MIYQFPSLQLTKISEVHFLIPFSEWRWAESSTVIYFKLLVPKQNSSTLIFAIITIIYSSVNITLEFSFGNPGFLPLTNKTKSPVDPKLSL